MSDKSDDFKVLEITWKSLWKKVAVMTSKHIVMGYNPVREEFPSGFKGIYSVSQLHRWRLLQQLLEKKWLMSWLQQVIDQTPKKNVLIIIDDFNGKVGE